METILIFIYSILQIILFTVVSTLATVYYFRKHNPFYIALAILFAFYTLDILVIMMTECVPSFSVFYDNVFLSVPTYKSLVLMVTATCMVFIYNSIFYDQVRPILYVPVIIMSLVWLFIPMFKADSLRVFIYYEIYQIFTLLLGASAYMNCMTNKVLVNNNRLLKLSVLIIIFSAFILIEDYIVIFYYDSYMPETVSIQNRCFTEDILRFILSFNAIVYLMHKIHPRLIREDDPEPFILNRSFTNTEENNKDLESNKQSEDEKFIHFCQHYDLTAREQEIFELILAYKSAPEISEILYIAPGTAKTHMHKIYQKLSVAKRSQLITVYNEYEMK